MRNAIAILMMHVLALNVLGQFGVLAWFQLNRRAITQRYCENRQRPAIHCNGKCYLAKQLKKTNSENAPNKKNNMGNEDLLFFIIPANVALPFRSTSTTNHLYGVYQSQAPDDYIAPIFQPPPVMQCSIA